MSRSDTGARGPVLELLMAPRTSAPTPVPSGQDEAAPVALVEWPREARRAEQLAHERRLRLFLVTPGIAPPVDWDGLSDWIRSPADAGDVYARIEALQRRSASARIDTRITLDEDGILRRGTQWVALAPAEEPMMRILLARSGAVVSRTELLGSGGAIDADANRVLDSRLRRLRDHVAPLRVRIVNVRRRGYLAKLDDA